MLTFVSLLMALTTEPNEVVTDHSAEVVTDHSAVVGRWGLGWFGMASVPYLDDPTGGLRIRAVAAPCVGGRYWLSEGLAFDFCAGLSITHNERFESYQALKGVATDSYEERVTAVLGSLGTTHAIYTRRHYAFILQPRLTFATASGSSQSKFVNPSYSPSESAHEGTVSSTVLRLSVRAGAEVHFGFLGLEQLALEASLGLELSRISLAQTSAVGEARRDWIQLDSVVSNGPLDFLRASVAARYYL